MSFMTYIISQKTQQGMFCYTSTYTIILGSVNVYQGCSGGGLIQHVDIRKICSYSKR